MSYKFQIGTAVHSGSITVGGDLTASANIESKGLNASVDLTLRGNSAGSGGSFDVQQNNHELNITGELQMSGGVDEPCWKMGDSSDNGYVHLVSGSTPVAYAKMWTTSNGGFAEFFANDGGSATSCVRLTGSTGALSASNNLEVGGNLDVTGDLTVAGDYIDRDDDDDSVQMADLNISGSTLLLNAVDGDGIMFGTGGAAGGIELADSNSAWLVQSGSTEMPISASAWYGSGAQLTNVTAGGLRLATTGVLTRASNNDDELTLGANYAEATSGQTFNLYLPDLGDYGAGVQITVKRTDSTEGATTLILVFPANGTGQEIDGIASAPISLGPEASVKLVSISSTEWAIFQD